MNRLLIAVKSCNEHMQMGYHSVIREAWYKDFPAGTVKFFVGAGTGKAEPDEIRLDCPDNYDGLPKKTQAICGWATSKMIDHVFLCDTDTFVRAVQLQACGYEMFDYAGKIDRPFGQTFPYIMVSREGQIEKHAAAYPWASGGFGYFLSKKALTLVAYTEPKGWAEDFFVGQLLNPYYNTDEVKMLHIPGGTVSEHFPAHEYGSGYNLKFGWMQKMYVEQK